MTLRRSIPLALLLALSCSRIQAQQPVPLDLGRNVKPLVHQPLPEQYIWTAGDATFLRADRSKHPWRNQQGRIAPHLFRKTIHLDAAPTAATLYIAGPRSAEVFINGQRLARFNSDIDAPIGFHVFHADAAPLLHAGNNTLAISAVRGRGVVSGDPVRKTAQLAYGEVLAVKLVAAPFGHDDAAVAISDPSWRSITTDVHPAPSGWADAGFDDSSWPAAESLGAIESSRDFMQWSADAGMFAWPGYMGMSAPLGAYTVAPAAITHVFEGQARFDHLDALGSFTLTTPPAAANVPDIESPAILVDFGRELAGRVLISSDTDAVISAVYGESELEALATGLTPDQRGGNYLGTNLLEVPANGAARGPKSAFRYVRLRFLRGAPVAHLRIQAEAIAYPVQYTGSFTSSDPLLNRIWETGAYTAHLCMQDDLWDAPKRDRGRWAGDIDVEGRVISTAFGEASLLERTLAALAPPQGSTRSVNGIPGYSALWITSLASLYAHAGDLEYLKAQHAALLRVLGSMDAALGPDHLFHPPHNQWPFIDWAPGLYGPGPAPTLGTSFQYLRAYRAAVQLLDAVGDRPAAEKAAQTADALQQALLPAIANGLGPTPQINALAIQSGAASPDAQRAIWTAVLGHVKQNAPEDPVISPYFNATVIDAMSRAGHARTALDWIRTYWGGMIAEGATSFWESYDLRWPKDNPHLSLQADGTSGYFVSLAHGWSTGPTAWFSENVLGIRDPQDGFRSVTIAPRLLGLEYARGSMPTPRGAIDINIRQEGKEVLIDLALPPGVEHANVQLEPGDHVVLDGKSISQSTFSLDGNGKHTIRYTPSLTASER